MEPSNTFTFFMSDAPGMDPRLFEVPILSSSDDFVAAVNQMFPNTLSRAGGDDFITYSEPAPDDGSSQSSNSLPCSPQTYGYHPLPYGNIDYCPPYSPTTTFASSPSPPTACRVLVEAQCVGGRPVKQKGGGYHCSSCNEPFGRRDEANRHIKTAGMQVTCRYCDKPSSARRDGQRRHLRGNKKCLKIWKAGHKAGRFTSRSVEDAYY